jgi:nucleoside diphosphate kinase
MILLFKCENAVHHIKDQVIGSFTRSPVGNTIRGTFGDCIQDEKGNIHYLEPAVLTGAETDKNLVHLRLFAKYAESDGGLLTGMIDYGAEPETTLVLIKPDNFYMPSRRPGNIIDTFSLTGLRIVGTKLFSMTVSQGEEFYGQLKDIFREKLKFKVSDAVYECLSEKFGFDFTKQDADLLADHLADRNAVCEFNRIVEYMTGVNPESVTEEEKKIATNAKCLALAYEGVDAVTRVRDVLGATNPEQAAPGTVRSDFGRDLMRNGAHASDSGENAQREMKIIGLTKDSGTCEFSEIINEYLENQ